MSELQEGKLLPFEPTEEQWGGLARHLIMWMQMSERQSAKSLNTHYKRFVGHTLPDWLLKEIGNVESDHQLPKGTLAVLIYKAMWLDYSY